MREGGRFERLLREIDRAQFLSVDDFASWHEAMLGKLLTHAVLHVPFYRALGLANNILDAKPGEVLATFPLIDKTIVREQNTRFMAENARRPLFKGSTSGTTGTPLVLYQDLAAINRENAFIWRQLHWAGFKSGNRRAWIRGDLVAPADQTDPPFWRMNYADNMLMLSSYHLSNDYAEAYIAALERFNPLIIQAYPSSIVFLARWLDAKGRDYGGSSLKGIVTSSETLAPESITLIERRFGARVFDWYGQFERVAAIGTCEHGRQHIVSDYSFVELLPAEDGLYEIVGTGFNNFAMPLIRYRTGDFVRLAAGDICPCGRSFPVIATVLGRTSDAVKLPDGRSVGRLDHIFKGVDGILEAQIRQDRLDRIDIYVVPAASFTTVVAEKLRANARERLGQSINIEVHTVSSIDRTKNGKLREVICNV